MATNGHHRKQRPSLRLDEYNDRELLALAADCQGADGHIDSQEVALAIWPRYAKEGPYGRMSVGQRFGYYKRHGFMQQVQPGIWLLTEDGEAVVRGKIAAAAQHAMNHAQDEQLMAIGYAIGERYLQAGDGFAVLLRRSFQYSHAQRRKNGAR